MKLLYVEDDEDLRDLFTDCLKEEFEEVVTCEDGSSAFDVFESQRFDLVVSDFKMPKRNGLDLFRDIRETGSDIPFVFLTGYSGELYSVAKGSLDFYVLDKPIQFEFLNKILSEIMELDCQRRDLEYELFYRAKNTENFEDWIEFAQQKRRLLFMKRLKISNDKLIFRQKAG